MLWSSILSPRKHTPEDTPGHTPGDVDNPPSCCPVQKTPLRIRMSTVLEDVRAYYPTAPPLI